MLTALERAFHLAKSGRVKERDDRRLGMARLIAENASGKRGGRDKDEGQSVYDRRRNAVRR